MTTAKRRRGAADKSAAKTKKAGSTRQKKKRARPAWLSRLENLGGLDMPFLAILLALTTIGLIMMFSASYTYCYYKFNGDSLYYFKRQLIFAIAGIIVMFTISRINYNSLKNLAIPILAVSYVLLVLVLFLTPPEGFEEFHRWIVVPVVRITFQPSEIAKFAVILFLAWHIDRHYEDINSKELQDNEYGIKISKRFYCTLVYLAVMFSNCILIYSENHVSGTLLMAALCVIMFWLAGYDKRYFIALFILGVILVVFVVKNYDLLPAHARSRIVAWIDKDYSPRDARWQTNHALYAIGSGGLFGVGLGNSKMKQMYVSEPQNDFIFSIVCEELGVIGALFIIALFALLVWRGFVIGLHARDKFGSLLAMGLVFQVGLQAALNITVVTDMIPNTGISLPFFSYGGTALLILFAEMGVVLSISRSAHLKKV